MHHKRPNVIYIKKTILKTFKIKCPTRQLGPWEGVSTVSSQWKHGTPVKLEAPGSLKARSSGFVKQEPPGVKLELPATKQEAPASMQELQATMQELCKAGASSFAGVPCCH